MKLIDLHGRKINYLRLSITDRCDLRCRYCMPSGGVEKKVHEDILSYEDLLQIARAAVSLGIEKIRVTGGEPLVRKGVVEFLSRLKAIPGLRQLVLTTNGMQLEEFAPRLAEAGVQRLNVSLDSLHPETFANITRRGNVHQVLAGIEAARKSGLQIKLNVVVMRGVNDTELADFAALTLDQPYAVRFIEYMPSLKDENWRRFLMPGQEILQRLAARFSFEGLRHDVLDGPSRNFRIPGAAGTLGIITPISGHFCDQCNRIRVTASGKVRNCLFSSSEMDLKPILAEGDFTSLRRVLQLGVQTKPERHDLSATETGTGNTPFAMSGIGG